MSSEEQGLETYVVEMAEGQPTVRYPLTNVYVKVREGDREVLERAPEVANDDDPDAARQSAAAIGRRAGQVEVGEEELDGEGRSFFDFFVGRGKARAEQARARGKAEQARLAATSGPVVTNREELDARDSLLETEEGNARTEARALHGEADRLDESRLGLHPIERGVIRQWEELLGAGILGLADFGLFGQFLEERGASNARLAWFTAALVGLGIGAAGWALGRGVIARATSQEDRRRGMLALLGVFSGSAVWFLIGMEITRASGGEKGELATIAFGAPLCALALIATAIISFLAGAGKVGSDLAARSAVLRGRAATFERVATIAKDLRHELRTNLARSEGAWIGAHAMRSDVGESTEREAAYELEEGKARWGLARSFARLYPPPDPIPPFDPRTLVGGSRQLDPRPYRLLAAALAALGAGAGALGMHAASLPTEAIAGATAVGAALGALIAPRPPAPDPLESERMHLQRTANGDGQREHA